MGRFWLLVVLAVTSVAINGVAYAQQKGIPAKDSIISERKNAKCVEPTSVMRREHMDFLLRQRDETMHRGIRTRDHSLKGCVDCHENMKRDNRVQSQRHEGRLIPSGTPVPVDDPENGFCQACHRYAAVNIDCFQCHLATSDADK